MSQESANILKDVKTIGSGNMREFDYVIVGGGLAGGNAAISIRENDATGSICIITDENHVPYDRVPLSKNYLLGKMKREVLYVKKPDFYTTQKIEMIIGIKVTGLDPKNHVVRTSNGTDIHYKKLLLATGGQARRLSILGAELDGVFYLRTVDDAEKIEAAMKQSKSAIVIGGGFIGCELASTFAKNGTSTTIIEAG
ncbi:MAG: FAD-dependent oxidoreductase, partial [Thaumarchaeota archaeon]|nr:FAD-dependent oxidoreductase [Nitrososphaerota archaeon]